MSKENLHENMLLLQLFILKHVTIRCIPSVSSYTPAVYLCFASKHCKVQEGLKKFVRLLDFMSGPEKDCLLVPAEADVSAFRGFLKAQWLLSAHALDI